MLSAAFDHRSGQILYVDSKGGTWGFDVCTNEWANLHPTGAPTGNISGGLVYDIDSDVTVSIEHDEIFVYDASRAYREAVTPLAFSCWGSSQIRML